VDNAEDFVPGTGAPDRMLVGKRSGFIFYRDHKLPRKILVGVFEGNVAVNNHYDGPFDQLPDNFLEGDILRKIIEEIEPEMKGKMDRFGGSFDGSQRYAIDPYVKYRLEDELRPLHECAVREQRAASYYNCFVADYDKDGGIHLRLKSVAKQSGKSKRAKPN
jgi:hypothetical protein